MAWTWGERNPADLTTDKVLFQIPCNCGGQITFYNLGDPNAAVPNIYYIFIDDVAKVKIQWVMIVKAGQPVTLKSETYLQEGQYHGVADNPNANGADILQWFGTWKPIGPRGQ